MWNVGKSISDIGKRFSFNAANVFLVIMDFEMFREIEPRCQVGYFFHILIITWRQIHQKRVGK